MKKLFIVWVYKPERVFSLWFLSTDKIHWKRVVELKQTLLSVPLIVGATVYSILQI